jgi:hypothetical protein
MSATRSRSIFYVLRYCEPYKCLVKILKLNIMGDYVCLSRFIIEILIQFSSRFLSVALTSRNEINVILIITE